MSAKRRANVEAYSGTSDDEEDNCSNDARDTSRYKASATCRMELSRKHENVVGRGKSSKRPCLNRNALMARENRQRKKEYVEKIEKKLSFYKEENKNLSNTIQRQSIDLKRLRSEVSYLRNVLNNSSSITNLLRSMNESLSSGTRRNNAKNCEPEKNDEIWKKRSSVGDSDHTYTNSSTDGSVQDHYSLPSVGKNDPDSKPSSYVGNKDLMPNGYESAFGIIDDLTDHQLDQLPFDFALDSPPSTIFNNNETDDNDFNGICGADSIDFPTTKLFDNLDNSGVCLHVNSGRISLEFCSICHLNSVNSSE